MKIASPGLHGRRHERLRVNKQARMVSRSGEEQQAVVQDISISGAAIAVDESIYSNDQFVDLHMEGHDRLTGRVVREFTGGYALSFEQNPGSNAKMMEEVEKFRKLAGKKDFMEG